MSKNNNSFPRLHKIFPAMDKAGKSVITKKKSNAFERAVRIAELALKCKEIKSGKSHLQIAQPRRNGEVTDFILASK